jgi:hypothetical protein
VVGLAEVGGRPRHAAGRRDRRHDPDLALHLPRGGGGQGRLGDPQGAQAARARPGADRLPDLRAASSSTWTPSWPTSSAGSRPTRTRSRSPCSAARSTASARPSHADFGITGAKNEGLIFSRGKALKKVPQEQLVDELFSEIDKYAKTKQIDVDAAEQAAGAEWLQRIEEENAGELTPERLAKLEAETPRADADAMDEALLLDESASPRGPPLHRA